MGPLQKRPRPNGGDFKVPCECSSWLLEMLHCCTAANGRNLCSSSQAQVPVAKQQPIQLGREIYEDADTESLPWRAVKWLGGSADEGEDAEFQCSLLADDNPVLVVEFLSFVCFQMP